MLDSLVSRVVILNQSGANARNFIRADTCANTASAHCQAALHLAGRYGASERDDEIGLVVTGGQAMCPKVDDFMSGFFEICDQTFL